MKPTIVLISWGKREFTEPMVQIQLFESATEASAFCVENECLDEKYWKKCQIVSEFQHAFTGNPQYT